MCDYDDPYHALWWYHTVSNGGKGSYNCSISRLWNVLYVILDYLMKTWSVFWHFEYWPMWVILCNLCMDGYTVQEILPLVSPREQQRHQCVFQRKMLVVTCTRNLCVFSCIQKENLELMHKEWYILQRLCWLTPRSGGLHLMANHFHFYSILKSQFWLVTFIGFHVKNN